MKKVLTRILSLSALALLAMPAAFAGKGKLRFTKEMDQQLRDYVAQYGENHWELVAKAMHLSPRQCREHWNYYLEVGDAGNKRWNPANDQLLLEKAKENNNQWSKVEGFFPGYNAAQLKNRHTWIQKQRGKTRGEPASRLDRVVYTKKMDKDIIDHVAQYGENNWKPVAEALGLKPEQCGNHYKVCLKVTPGVKMPWNDVTDKLLVDKVEELGTRWKKIMEYFPGCSRIELQNRWNTIQRRQARDQINMPVAPIAPSTATPAVPPAATEGPTDGFELFDPLEPFDPLEAFDLLDLLDPFKEF